MGPVVRLPRFPAALLALLAAVGLLRLGLMLASGAGLHVDEAQYWDWSRTLQGGYYSKPPMVALLIRAGTALFGDTLVGVRIGAMACWLGASAALWWLASRVVAGTAGLAAAPANAGDAGLADRAGDPDLAARAGLWAALLLLITPPSGLLGLAATTDAPLMLAWALLMGCTWQALASGRWRWWVAAGLALGFGLLAKYTMAACAMSAALLLWRLPAARRGRALAGLLLAGLIGAACLAPNLAWNAANGWPTLRHTADITTRAQRDDSGHGRLAGAAASVGEFVGGQLLMAGPVALVVGVAAWRRRRGAAATPAPTCARGAAPATASPWPLQPEDARWATPTAYGLLWALPLLAVATAQAAASKAQVNWAAPALCGLALMTAAWAAAAWPADAGRRWRRGALLAGLALPVAVLLLPILRAGGIPRAPVVQAAVSAPAGAPTTATAAATAAASAAASPGADVPREGWRWDIWARMRGWQPVLAALAPQIAAHPGLPVVGQRREWLVQSAWAWRQGGQPGGAPLPAAQATGAATPAAALRAPVGRALAWPPQGHAQHHYELQHPLPTRPWPPQILWLGDDPPDAAQRQRYAQWRRLAQADAEGVHGELWLGSEPRDDAVAPAPAPAPAVPTPHP